MSTSWIHYLVATPVTVAATNPVANHLSFAAGYSIIIPWARVGYKVIK